MKRWRITFASKRGNQYMTLLAGSKQEAEQLAQEAQARRHARFGLTYGRLEGSLESGTIDPMLSFAPATQRALKAADGGSALMEGVVKAEIEKRKHDQARYEDGFKIAKIEEVK